MSKAGPPAFRRQLYLAADVARRYDPPWAAVYYREMVKKGNPHTKATIACTRRLLHRIVRVMRTKEPYELRHPNGQPMDAPTARTLIKETLTVPDDVRDRLRHQKKAS